MTIVVTMDGVRLMITLCCYAILAGIGLGDLYLQPASPQAFFTGQEFAVTCYASSLSSQMTWKSPMGEITETEGRLHVESDEGEGQSSLRLVVQGAHQNDAGDYVCSAKIGDKTLRETFKLIVYRSITFAGTPEEQVTTEGGDATVLCHAVADPSPVITWTFNGSSVPQDGRFHKTKGGLEIRNVSRADEGTYTCRAILVGAKNSQVKSIDIRLRVQYAPEWHEPHMIQAYSSPGYTADLICEAHGFPAPKYAWIRDGDVIENSETYNITHQGGKSILHVVVTNDSEFGDYLCRASNSLDSKERVVTLIKGETPRVPNVDRTRSEPGKMYLKLSPEEESNRAANEDLEVLGFRVQFRPSSVPWHMAKSRDFTLEEEIVLNGLDRSEEYVVRAAARNAAGLSAYSEDLRHHPQPLDPATVKDVKDGAPWTVQSWTLIQVCLLLSTGLRPLRRFI